MWADRDNVSIGIPQLAGDGADPSGDAWRAR
jgi:hypothetical protein